MELITLEEMPSGISIKRAGSIGMIELYVIVESSYPRQKSIKTLVLHLFVKLINLLYLVDVAGHDLLSGYI